MELLIEEAPKLPTEIQTLLDIDKSETCFISGPRPVNLPSKSYDPRHEKNRKLIWKLHDSLLECINEKGIKNFVVGMALGIDTWAALILLKLKEDERYSHIKIIAAVPTELNPYWKDEDIAIYHRILDGADYVVNVHTLPRYIQRAHELSPRTDKPFIGQLHARNHFMVDISHHGLAVYDRKNGGTHKCLMYAATQLPEKNIQIINAKTLELNDLSQTSLV